MSLYATLFNVDILHDYFLNRGSVVHEALNAETKDSVLENFTIGSFMDIVPTERTQARLSGHQMMFKTTRTGFLVAVKTDSLASDLRPVVPPAEDFQLSFKLSIRDPRFFNYTEINAAKGLYRFGNASGNNVASQLFLTAPVPGFETTRAHEAGAIFAVSTAGVVNLFRAIRDTGPSGAPVAADWERIPADTWDPSKTYASGAIVLFGNFIYRALVNSPGADLSNSGKWEVITLLANQYACSADKLQLRPPVFNLDLNGAALAQATVRVFRLGETDAAAERAYIAPSGTLSIVQIDLRELVAGAYRLEVLDSAQAPVPSLGSEFYLDEDAVQDAWFGVIEIGAGSGDFALLDAGDILRSPRYTLRFLNRSTRWRYIFPQAQAVGVGADVAVEGSEPRVLVTGSPRPLTYYGASIRLQADNAGTPAVSEEVLLSLPEPHRIRRDNQQWYSEIQMSNVSL